MGFDVRGIRWLPVRLEVQDQRGGWVILGQPHSVVEVRVGQPGAHWLASSRLRLRDCLGIFEWRRLAGPPEPLLILPTPDVPAALDVRPSERVDDPELQGLRPYTAGTPLSRIHWAAFARGGGLQVRHVAPAASGLPLVVVETAAAPSLRAVHWTARTAAGYILALVHAGGCRVMLPGDASETSVTERNGEWQAMHRRLAALATGPPSHTRLSAPPVPAVRVRATAAPAGLAPATPLPPGVVPAGAECSILG
jgi:uncharacterized protein (DUF58 family)